MVDLGTPYVIINGEKVYKVKKPIEGAKGHFTWEMPEQKNNKRMSNGKVSS